MEGIDPLVFGHRLRHFRKRKGMTLEDLGEVMGRPAPFLSLLENGKREPRLSQITALAEALGVGFDDLCRPEPPNRRARLEIELDRAQEHPRYRRLGLPHLKATARLPDEAIEHVLALFQAATTPSPGNGQLDPGELRRANGELTLWLRQHDGYLEEVEKLAADALAHSEYGGTGPLTSRHLGAITDAFGYRIRPVDDIPASLRSVVDHEDRIVYVAQRNELRTRQARKAILQTLGSIALGHTAPATPFDLLRNRLETSYFAAAVLIPEDAAVAFLGEAKRARDLSIEDVKEQFYVSYEMAGQRFTNLATRHLGLRSHFIRSDDAGLIWKAYANDGLPLPADGEGGSEGQRLCRRWGPRAAFASDAKFDIHHQFTDTPAGSFWSATHISADLEGHAFTVGVRFADARFFRGRTTDRHLESGCPDRPCCRLPHPELAGRWEGKVGAHARLQEQILGLLKGDLDAPLDQAELFEFADRHRQDPVHERPFQDDDVE